MKKTLSALLAVLILLFSLAGCGQKAASGYPVTVGETTLTSSPMRVVCMSQSLTEDVAMLGFADRIVGVSDDTARPGILLDAVERCGVMLLPDTAAILSLAPDLVLTGTALPSDTAAALEKAGIQTLLIPYTDSYETMLSNLSALAVVFAGSEEGALLGEQVAAYAEETLSSLAPLVDPDMRAVFLMRLPGAAATGDTWLGEVMERLGIQNAAFDGSGWYWPGEDGSYEADILFCAEGIDAAALADSVWKDSSAVQNGRVVFFDEVEIEGQTPGAFSVIESAVKSAYS